MYQKNALQNLIIDNETQINSNREKIYDNFHSKSNEKSDFKTEIFIETINMSFNLRIVDIKIGFACATFKKFIKNIGKEVEFTIHNDYLEPNFDFIKFHFPKIFKSKIIKANVSIELHDNKIVTKIVKCSKIEEINKEFIDIVKYQRIFELIKNPKIEQPDKTLYTVDDIFSEFEENELGNVFKQNGQEILSIILNEKKVRNRKQLEYLSGRLQSDKEVIRFSLKSKRNNFGFLFYIDKGETKHHFVWELINSHATYIWSIEKNKKNIHVLFKQINNTINTIKIIGRNEYKEEYKNRMIDQDFEFDNIYHKHANSDFIDHFPNWRKQLDEKIV